MDFHAFAFDVVKKADRRTDGQRNGPKIMIKPMTIAIIHFV
jgi:hypothetical protein